MLTTERNTRLRGCRRGLELAAFLFVVGVCTVPVQWYIAYRGVRRRTRPRR